MSQFHYEFMAVIWASATTGFCIEIVGVGPMVAIATTLGVYVVWRAVEAVGRIAWDLATAYRRGSA